eukprot:TRINITY_DN7462_c0_g1_i1.p2 TRINITY_DN7462_c0_g1~~TRINITY_DN7462_c0_g1_i1.p2  ORF type:complete len:118 (-),score=12.26 TRINITY_DN7462_c0_g1_i1:409-762(-)
MTAVQEWEVCLRKEPIDFGNMESCYEDCTEGDLLLFTTKVRPFNRHGTLSGPFQNTVVAFTGQETVPKFEVGSQKILVHCCEDIREAISGGLGCGTLWRWHLGSAACRHRQHGYIDK